MTDEKTEIEKTSENPKDSKKDEDEKNKPKVPYFRLVSSMKISDFDYNKNKLKPQAPVHKSNQKKIAEFPM